MTDLMLENYRELIATLSSIEGGEVSEMTEQRKVDEYIVL